MIVERLRRSQPRQTTNDTEKTDAQENRAQYNPGGRDDLALACSAAALIASISCPYQKYHRNRNLRIDIE
jgi:hypothetical protein